MTHSITLKSFIDKLDKTIDFAKKGLPLQAKAKMAKKLLLWSASTPGPPVDTGRLLRSGTAWIGKKKVASLGGDSGHTVPDESDNVITISYSSPKLAKDKAKVFYPFGGSHWFDYASYQHKKHAINKLWIQVLLTRGLIERQVDKEVGRAMREIW